MFVSQNLTILLEGSLDINQVPLLHLGNWVLEPGNTSSHNCVLPTLELVVDEVLESTSLLLFAWISHCGLFSWDKWLTHYPAFHSYKICFLTPFPISPQDLPRIWFFDQQAFLPSFLEVSSTSVGSSFSAL